MATDRRTVLTGLMALLASPAAARGKAGRDATVIAANTRQPDGSFAAVLYDIDRGLLRRVALPGRGHDVAVNPATGDCVAFARRPGNFAVAFGRPGASPPVVFTTPPGRHFYGHGVFSADGRLLFTTENDIAGATGIIGIWDATAGFRRIGELPSFGVGPHDINLLRDRRTLVIANGGIATHPDHGRTPLNLATMRPSLVYADAQTGDLLERHILPADLHKLSIRHLEIATNDTVVFGCQFKGPKSAAVDLIGSHRRGAELRLLDAGPAVARALKHYVSSIAVDRSGDVAVFTSSRGQRAVFVDVAAREVRAIKAFPDVSGIAAGATRGGFVLTGGGGDVAATSANATSKSAGRRAAWNWDNHAVRAPV